MLRLMLIIKLISVGEMIYGAFTLLYWIFLGKSFLGVLVSWIFDSVYEYEFSVCERLSERFED